MFGDGYVRTESRGSLDCGVYEARIADVKPSQWKSGDLYVEITFEVPGKEGAYPNKYNFNDAPKKPGTTMTLEQLMHIWNQNATKFFDNFGIKDGDFNIQNWRGRTGKITVRQQKNKPEYKEILPYEARFDAVVSTPTTETAAFSPAPVQNIQNAFSGEIF